jgi:hypothetical protein
MIIIVHISIPPDIINHPIYLLTQAKPTLFFYHQHELLLEMHAYLIVIQDPSKEPDLKLFYEPFLIRQ